jgi:hypothetical protein
MRACWSLALVVFATNAWACTCGPATVEEEFTGSSAVFLATVISTTLTGDPTTRELWRTQLEVEKVWKSDRQPLTSIVTPYQTGACATYLVPGAKYIIFATRYLDGTLETISCNRTIPVAFTEKCKLCEPHWTIDKARVAELLNFLNKSKLH